MGVGLLGRTWHETDIPGQAGRVAVVTGANAGIGLRVATVLAGRGATVVLACRDTKRAERAADTIRAGHPGASVAVVRLDLASLASVREAAAEISERYSGLALLINNAGVMEPPYTRTADGFELTFATNHLGHFALTGLLLDRLLDTLGARVVTMSSMAHLDGVPDFGDPGGERDYDAEAAYARSKLANLMFSYELDRRLRAAGSLTMALAAHPGVALTALFHTRSPVSRLLLSPAMRPVNFWAVQNVRMAALPVLRAATDPGAVGGEFYGPRRRHDTGYPARVSSSPQSYQVEDQARLWQLSERVTGVHYRFERTAV